MKKLISTIALAVASLATNVNALEVGNFLVYNGAALINKYTTYNETPNNMVKGVAGTYIGVRLQYDTVERDVKTFFMTVDKVCELNGYKTTNTRIIINDKPMDATSYCNPSKSGERIIATSEEDMLNVSVMLTTAEMKSERLVFKLDSGLVISTRVNGYIKTAFKISS